MRIIVTGGAGFIGSHIVDAYTSLGHEVVVIDNLWAEGGGKRENLPPHVRLIHMDIRDDHLKPLFAQFKPQIVSHHAAQHCVAIGSRDPQYDASVNVGGTLNVLEAAVGCGASKVIFASSAATYGAVDDLPVDETSPQRPSSPYGITKMVTEHYLRFFHSEYGLSFTALRYGNVYGPRQDPSGEAGVIGIFIDKILKGDGIRIDWDGEQTRDYVYVGDVVRANVAALSRGSDEIYVIGTGIQTSVNQIYRAVAAATGIESAITYAPRRLGDARDVYFCPSKAEHGLSWRAQISLRDGVDETVAYFRERMVAAST